MMRFALTNEGYLLTDNKEFLVDCFNYYYDRLEKIEKRVLKPDEIGKYKNRQDYKLLIESIKNAINASDKSTTTIFLENGSYYTAELDLIERNLDLLKRSIDHQIQLEKEEKEEEEKTVEYEAKVEKDLTAFVLQALRQASTQDLKTQDALAIIAQFRNGIGITNMTSIASKMANTFTSSTKRTYSSEMRKICKYDGCLFGEPVTEVSTILENNSYRYKKSAIFICERCGKVLPVVQAKCLAAVFAWDGDSKEDLFTARNNAVEEYSRSKKPIQLDEKSKQK